MFYANNVKIRKRKERRSKLGEKGGVKKNSYRFFLSRAFSTIFSLSLGFRCSFCQPARTVSFFLSTGLSLLFRLLSVPLPLWPMLLTHSENGSSSFRRSIMPSSYTNQVIAVAAKGTETWCTKMEGYNVPVPRKFLFPHRSHLSISTRT